MSLSWPRNFSFFKEAKAHYRIQKLHDQANESLKHTQVYYLFNLLKPTGYVMHQQFNIQQLYVLPTLYLCVLYLSENK